MRKAVPLLLALVMLLSLCACGGEKPASTIPDQASPSYLGGSLAKSTQPPIQTEPTETTLPEPQSSWPTQRFSNDGGTSIDVLREEIARAGAMFGVAYIGLYSQAEMLYGEWFESTACGLADSYPFVREIDQDHTIGTRGHLYCIVGGDFGTSISARTLDGQVLYEADNGNPVLLFCNRDGEGLVSDTIVTVTTADGTEYRWEPRLYGENYPEPLIGPEGQFLSWDFTVVYDMDMGFELTGWLREGWLGPTEIGLGGVDVLNPMTWWLLPEEENAASYCLTFCPNASSYYDGEVTMDCFYGEDTQVQAHWEGWWRVTTQMDYASWLDLDLVLMDGVDQQAFSDADVIAECFMTLLSPSGENLLLVSDSTQTALPIFPNRRRFCELTLAMG